MKFYLDSANLSEVQNGVKLGVFAGVTTNPSILAKEPKTDFWAHIKKSPTSSRPRT